MAKQRPRPPAIEALAPTPERLARGTVERLARPIADEAGRPTRPYRAVDTLAVMERRGSITSGMRAAGDDFRIRFNKAHLDPLHAARLERVGHSPTVSPGFRIEAARDGVWRAITAVGGLASPAGSVLWHVVGLEQTVKQWALEYRLAQEVASGILIAALGVLEAHYDGSL